MTTPKPTALLVVEGVIPSTPIRLSGRCIYSPVRTELAGHNVDTSPVEAIRLTNGNWVAETRNTFYILEIDQEMLESIRRNRPEIFS